MSSKKGYLEPDLKFSDFKTLCVLSGSDTWTDSLTGESGQDDFYGGFGGGNNG